MHLANTWGCSALREFCLPKDETGKTTENVDLRTIIVIIFARTKTVRKQIFFSRRGTAFLALKSLVKGVKLVCSNQLLQYPGWPRGFSLSERRNRRRKTSDTGRSLRRPVQWDAVRVRFDPSNSIGSMNLSVLTSSLIRLATESSSNRFSIALLPTVAIWP